MSRCQCCLVDWSGGPGKYKYVSTGEIYDPFIGTEETGITIRCGEELDCQAKVNAGIMGMDDYYQICKYIPGDPGSKFPVDVYVKLLNGGYS